MWCDGAGKMLVEMEDFGGLIPVLAASESSPALPVDVRRTTGSEQGYRSRVDRVDSGRRCPAQLRQGTMDIN